MIKHLFKLSYAAALLFAALALAPTAASAGGCCEPVPQPIVVYQQSCSCCGCGGGSYYSAYAPAYAYPSAYYGYAAYGAYGYGGYGGYGSGYGYGYGSGYGYPGYGLGYGYGAYRAATAPYRYVNRFWRPRAVGGLGRWR
jgi:hypothetical protein